MSGNINSFIYEEQSDPKRSCKIFYTVVSKEDGNEVPASLKKGQLDIINSALKDEIHLKAFKNYNLKIQVLKEDTFNIIIDNKTKFFISVKANKETLVIEEKIDNKNFFDKFSIRQVWQTIVNLFYTPSYPDDASRKRDRQEAIRQDFSLLRKSLESGKAWLQPKQEIKVSGSPQQHREDLHTKIDVSVQNAAKIEKALKSKKPEQELNKLASQWSNQIFGEMKSNEELLIPVGYLNSQNTLEPVMLRFYNKERKLCLEIYAETLDAGAKINPIQLREFTRDYTQQQLKDVLNDFFNLLVPAEPRQLLHPESSKAFAQIYETEKEKQLSSLGLGKKKEEEEVQPGREKVTETPVNLTFEGIMRAVDQKMGANWKSQEVERLKSPATTSAGRTVKYFDHLLSQMGGEGISKNGKLNLLYHLMNNWLEDQEKQIGKKTSNKKQLEIYENCSRQLDHVVNKLAMAINDGHPIDAQGIPSHLKEKKKFYEEKIHELQNKLRVSSVELTDAFLETSLSEKINLSGRLGSKEAESTLPQTNLQPVQLDHKEWESRWIDSQTRLKDLLSEENSVQYRADRAVLALAPFIEAHDLSWEEFATELSEGKEEECLGEIIEELLVKSGALEKIFQSIIEAKSYSDFTSEDFLKSGLKTLMKISPKEGISEIAKALKQVILFPHLFPVIDQSKTVGVSPNHFLSLVSRLQDSEFMSAGAQDENYAVLKAVLDFKDLISGERRVELEKIQSEKQADNYVAIVGLQTEKLEQLLADGVGKIQEILDVIPELDSSSFELNDPVTSQAQSTQHVEAVVKEISELVDRCNELNEMAINEPDIEKRKQALQQVREYSLASLKAFPPPMAGGALGEKSVWTQLNQDQSLAISEKINQLEHLVWETQMKLSDGELDARDRFLMIKAQTIRLSLVRTQIKEVKRQVEEIIGEAYKKDKDHPLIQELLKRKDISIDENQRIHIISPNILIERLKELVPEGTQEPLIGLLLFNNFSFESFVYNELLSQDLTARLSQDAELEKDMVAVYHFITRDYNNGATDTLETGQMGARPEFRVPLFNNIRNAAVPITGVYRSNPVNQLTLEFSDENPAKAYLEQMAHSFYMYRTMEDPDFTLYTQEPIVGVPFFQARPTAFISQKRLEIGFEKSATRVLYDKPSIRGEGNKKIALIHVEGNSDFSNDPMSQEKDEKLLSKRRPFLPVVDNASRVEHEINRELRTYLTYSAWLSYVETISQGESLAVPRSVLTSLFLIRESQSSKDKKESTCYTSETPVRALTFLTQAENQKYLQYDFVQKYLEDTLFGSFQMQQALVDHPESIHSLLEPLLLAIENARENGDDLALGFLTNVLEQLYAHAKFTQNSLAKEGFLSGLLIGTLPAHLGKPGGAIERTLQIVNGSLKLNKGSHSQIGINPDDPPKTHFAEIMLTKFDKVNEVVATLQGLVEDGRPQFKEYYFKEEEGGYRIDQVKNLSVRKQMYLFAIEQFKQSNESLSEQDFRHILVGADLLLDQAIEGGDPLSLRRAIEWVHTTVLPQFHQLSGEQKNEILTEVANAKLVRNKKEVVQGKWVESEENPSVYRLDEYGTNLELNLYTGEMRGLGAVSTKMEKFIPYSILAREEVRQALKSDKILATEAKQDRQVTYEWEHDQQQFKLVVTDKVILQRTATIKDPQGQGRKKVTYTFQPVQIEDVEDNAHALLAENGFWISNENQAGFLMTNGMKRPQGNDTFVVKYERLPDGSFTVDHLETTKGQLVSTSPRFDETSPLLFAANQNLIVLLKEDKTAGEFRLKNSNIRFRFDESIHNWVAYRNREGRSPERLGVIEYPRNEKTVEAYFGENWDQFVVPLVTEEGKNQYLLIPYNQEVDTQGKVAANQLEFTEMDRIELLKTNDDESIKGSVSSDLYLAHRFILQANKTKNPTAARALFLRAETLLQKSLLAKPPSDPVQLKQLLQVIDMIKANPPVSGIGVPSQTALALNLRLWLSVRNLRNNISVPSQRVLLLSPAEDFKELETMTKLYQNYLVLNKAASREKIHKTILNLSEGEKAQLQMISRQLVQDAAMLEKPEVYFATSARLKGALTQERPKELDPQFLLALLREAKRPDGSKDIRNVMGPLPLNDLLENFWSYFASIREHQIEPQDLIFLFSESVLPPTASKQELENLKRIDLQARQFLLTFADLQTELKKDPKEMIEKGLEEGKARVREAFGPKGGLSNILGVLKADLGLQASQMAETFYQIEVVPKEIVVGSKTIAVPDVDKLAQDINVLDARLFQFGETIRNLTSTARQFAAQYREEYEQINKELTQVESSLQAIEPQSVKGKEKEKEGEEWATDLEEKRRELQDQLRALDEKKVKNPINGEEIEVAMIRSGEFENAFHLEELAKLSSACFEIHKSFEESVKSATEAKQKLDLLIRLETGVAELQTKEYKPHPTLTFPEDEASQRKLREFMEVFKQANIQSMSFFEKANFLRANASALFKDLGVRKGFGFINKLLDYQKGQLSEKIALFALPLEGLALLPTQKPIVVGEQSYENQIPFELETLLLSPSLYQCFTQEQIEEINEQFPKLNKAQQRSYLSKLAEVAKLSETTLSAQTGLSANLSRIDAICEERGILTLEEDQRPLAPPRVDEKLLATIEPKTSGFDKKYRDLFVGGSPMAINSESIRKLLEEKYTLLPGDNKPTTNNRFQYLKESFFDEQKPIKRLGTHFQNPEFLPLTEALKLLIHAGTDQPERVGEIINAIKAAKDPNEMLEVIESGYRELSQDIYQKEHFDLVEKLSETLPDEDSFYRDDLETGFKNLEQSNPLPYSDVILAENLNDVRSLLIDDIGLLKENLKSQEAVIVEKLKNIPVKDLPKTLQLIRFRNGTDQELLQAAYFQHSNGHFAKNDPELDKLISKAQIDATHLKILSFAKFNALRSLDTLDKLKQQREELVKGLEGADEKKQEGILKKIKDLDTSWLKESNRLKDCLDRCQSTEQLTRNDFPDRLKPHIRKIIYLQNKLGVVLRNDQIDALREMIENPSLLLQMRMGLGKTSILTPFISSILAAEGYNVIVMVPKSQFAKNFDEMDETTRVLFEVAEKQFLFDRQSAPKPFTPVVLQKISQQCHDFFAALGGVQLTTIESKASLDDKINEIEESQFFLQENLRELEELGPESEKQAKLIYESLTEHQIALDLLYRVKATFEHTNTRLIIDEADQVGRANYAVNSEIGVQEKPAPLLVQTISTIFSIIQREEELEPLREAIFFNHQFTLKKDQVDEYIGAVGRAWLKEQQGKPGFPDALKDAETQEKLIEWFQGNPSEFTRGDFQEMGSFANELKAMRKGLNQALRSSLGLKVGLNADLDPIHSALGVPASQGITSATTKYSDPMMQLCLSNLIALYKVQGEKFIDASAGQVIKSLGQQIEEATGENQANLVNARQILIDLAEKKKEGGVPNYRKALTGTEPEKVILRLEFAKQVADRKLIYISSGQISRAVQNALRGCNVIGLTGTATRNLTYVLGSNGNKEAMKNIDATGRQTTAEVVYRWAKSLPNGLETQVKTYPSANAMPWLASFAKKNSGYNFLINQAGVCDAYTQREIVRALHGTGNRPIVYLDIETDKNSVMINGVLKAMEDLSPGERRIVQEEGFYYYHTPHARGTHFDIPTGSKGALMLSPNVNASDRDQAAYRARELGEGHDVEPFISETQYDEIASSEVVKAVTLKSLLKAQHTKTLSDEEKENLSAYKLHITGQLILAADKSKRNIQLTARKISQKGDWSQDTPDNREKIEAKAVAFKLLKNFFIQDSGNSSVLRKLDQEITQGGEVPTQVYLKQLVESEIQRGERLLASVDKEIKANRAKPSVVDGLTEIAKQVQLSLEILKDEQKRIQTEWKKLAKQLPQTNPMISSDQETAEVEADKETEEEKEMEVETSIETETKRRKNAAKNILESLDEEAYQEAISKSGKVAKQVNAASFAGIVNENRTGLKSPDNIWKPNIVCSPRLKEQIAREGVSEMKIVIAVRQNDPHFIGLFDPWEGDNVTSLSCGWVDYANLALMNGGVFQVTAENNGDLKLIYMASPPLMEGVKEQYNTPLSQAEILLALIHIGVTRLTDEQWGGIENYWRDLGENERKELHTSLEDSLAKTNPSFLNQVVGPHLWDKKDEVLTFGQTEKKEVVQNYEKGVKDLEDYMKPFEQTNIASRERQLYKWLDGIEDEKLKLELEEHGKEKYLQGS